MSAQPHASPTNSGPPEGVTRDEELLRRFVTGDDRACRAVERWAREIVRFRPYGIPPDEHDDIVQQALAGVWEACSKSGFILRASLGGLVRRVVMARCVDWLRGRRENVELDEAQPDLRPGPTELLEESEQWARVRWAIGRLSPAGQKLIRLHFLEHLPYARMVAELGGTEGALRVRMFQTMEQVRRLLGASRTVPEHPRFTGSRDASQCPTPSALVPPQDRRRIPALPSWPGLAAHGIERHMREGRIIQR